MPVSGSDWLLYFGVVLLPAAVVSYLCGCFNGAVIVSKYILRDDVRNHGSGNAGLTNFYRTFGGGLSFVVVACDMLKALAAVRLSMALLGGSDFSKYWAAVFCLLGHMFPCMFRFKGGKGVLSSGAIVLMLDWRVALTVWGVFLVLAVATRYVSLGSCCGAAAFPVATWLVYRLPVLTLLAAVAAGLIVFMHRGNLKRLLAGEESKFTFQHKK